MVLAQVYEPLVERRALLDAPAHAIEEWNHDIVYLEAIDDPFTFFSEESLAKVEALNRYLRNVMTGTGLARFEREVIACPLANAPRLAYADAVEAHDPDRARLIRTQIEALRIRRQNGGHTSESRALSEKARKLVERHGERWRPRFDIPNTEMYWNRGFVGSVRMDAADFLAHGVELLDLAPVLHVELRNARGLGRKLFSFPLLRCLLSLSVVTARLDDGDAAALAQSPFVDRLVWLDLRDNSIGNAGLEAIAASPHLQNLQWLGFAFNNAPDPTRIGENVFGLFREPFGPTRADLIRRFGPKPWLDHPRADDTWPSPEELYPIEDP